MSAPNQLLTRCPWPKGYVRLKNLFQLSFLPANCSQAGFTFYPAKLIIKSVLSKLIFKAKPEAGFFLYHFRVKKFLVSATDAKMKRLDS
jgi:hypothetical protein